MLDCRHLLVQTQYHHRSAQRLHKIDGVTISSAIMHTLKEHSL